MIRFSKVLPFLFVFLILSLGQLKFTWADDGNIVRFAVIGDYGSGNKQERDIADLIKSWNPDFITTTGDNNHPVGSAETIDRNIGQFFHEYISSYKGNILDFNSKIEYNPWKHFGFGLGIHSHRMNILGHKEGENLFDFNAYIKTGYTGLLFYGKFYF